MNKFIVITSINKKTEAIKKYDKNGDWNLIVIGDKKTPNIKLSNGIYLSLRDQKKLKDNPNLNKTSDLFKKHLKSRFKKFDV